MTNEELEQEVKRLEEKITKLKFKMLESKLEKKPYEGDYPKNLEDLYYTDVDGAVDSVGIHYEYERKEIYKRGLVFKTVEEAEKYDKERLLLFKLHKWAEEHNKGWKPNWKDENELKYYISYDNEDGLYEIQETINYSFFSKLPYFKSEGIARKFVKEFGEEIEEVLC